MLGGALVVSDADAASRLKQERTLTGATPGSLEVWLLMRSLRTLPLRVEAQSRGAEQLAAWLAGPEAPDAVIAVHHPSLPWCEGHALTATQMPGGYGAMLSFEVRLSCSGRLFAVQMVPILYHATAQTNHMLAHQAASPSAFKRGSPISNPLLKRCP